MEDFTYRPIIIEKSTRSKFKTNKAKLQNEAKRDSRLSKTATDHDIMTDTKVTMPRVDRVDDAGVEQVQDPNSLSKSLTKLLDRA